MVDLIMNVLQCIWWHDKFLVTITPGVLHKHMFQVFSGVSYVCLQVFSLDVAYVCNGFQMLLGIFASVLDACFKFFICLLLYIATVVSGCFKSRSNVAYEMRVESGRRRGWRSGRCERCPRQREPGARRLFALCAGSIQTLASESDVRAPIPYISGSYISTIVLSGVLLPLIRNIII
jgi:hypothetical protein